MAKPVTFSKPKKVRKTADTSFGFGFNTRSLLARLLAAFPPESFWLAIVLMLKRNGVRVPDAQRIADFAREGVRGVTQNLNWERYFDPFRGMLVTKNQWCVEIGDMQYIRLVTTANPSVDGLYAFPWTLIGKGTAADDAVPVVTIRLDLARLARMMI